ncbi:group II truncated hemoglobin [Atopomonas sediminilitoris]|uniref:group II truncated hemoglobin n=1 Tax=Atopomonas sediminilitoris TaxID=2919919 RepID=UPI001F4D6CDE|nr:group II truncated hemoglobin [Atopomonas sediminilitoris]MCJ8170601.1 group II truncated hemoglobin [Atopomonas sediminilitoris]
MQITDQAGYGYRDTSFQAAGGEAGITQLVRDFYQIMDAQAPKISQMHPADRDVTIDKLAKFLCGWLGGPRLFSEHYGPISIPQAHAHLSIGIAERDAWLACMQQAIAQQPYAADFADYLLAQLRIPAERVYQVSQ